MINPYVSQRRLPRKHSIASRGEKSSYRSRILYFNGGEVDKSRWPRDTCTLRQMPLLKSLIFKALLPETLRCKFSHIHVMTISQKTFIMHRQFSYKMEHNFLYKACINLTSESKPEHCVSTRIYFFIYNESQNEFQGKLFLMFDLHYSY